MGFSFFDQFTQWLAKQVVVLETLLHLEQEDVLEVEVHLQHLAQLLLVVLFNLDSMMLWWFRSITKCCIDLDTRIYWYRDITSHLGQVSIIIFMNNRGKETILFF